jgi:tetratricopeptide (TPR) repeat protein
MLRLVGFFAIVLVAYRLLSAMPVVGPILWRLGFIGYWVVAILVSAVLARVGERLLARARLRKRMQELGNVETPNNQGKLGLMLLQGGRVRAAVPHLEAAFAGQPEVTDWAFGLGRAMLTLGKYEEAGRYFARVVTDDPQHGYGAAYTGLAEAALALGRAEGALEALDTHKSYHGVNPTALYLRGRALLDLGRKDEAREAFGAVLDMGKDLPKFQRKGYLGLALKAMVARWR